MPTRTITASHVADSNASTRLTCITARYGWFTIIAPILVAVPGYFSGDLSFGTLMMIVGAFMQVQGGFAMVYVVRISFE